MNPPIYEKKNGDPPRGPSRAYRVVCKWCSVASSLVLHPTAHTLRSGPLGNWKVRFWVEVFMDWPRPESGHKELTQAQPAWKRVSLAQPAFDIILKESLIIQSQVQLKWFGLICLCESASVFSLLLFFQSGRARFGFRPEIDNKQYYMYRYTHISWYAYKYISIMFPSLSYIHKTQPVKKFFTLFGLGTSKKIENDLDNKLTIFRT